MRIAGRAAVLVSLWLLAWGDVTFANLVSGAVVAAVLLVAFPLGRRRGSAPRPRPVGIMRLIAYVATQLVISNVVMTGQILRRRPSVRPGVLAHRLERPSEEVLTVMTSIIALSPGTMVADVTSDAAIIYVHFFELRDVSAARASLRRLERLVDRAIGAPQRAGPIPTKEAT